MARPRQGVKTMSRTDKDMPYWVTAEWWEPRHYRCPHTILSSGRACDLSAEPVLAHTSGPRRCCRWEPVPDRHGPGSPPRWFVDLIFEAPTQARVRDDCRRAVTEYRATRDVDVIPPTTQHRHAARWNWW